MFKKGDYIVCLNTPEYDTSFTKNYIFKQKSTDSYLLPELDVEGSTTNGWGMIDFARKEEYSNWRYATNDEILEYDRIGKPFNTSKFKPHSFVDNDDLSGLYKLFKKLKIK